MQGESFKNRLGPYRARVYYSSTSSTNNSAIASTSRGGGERSAARWRHGPCSPITTRSVCSMASANGGRRRYQEETRQQHPQPSDNHAPPSWVPRSSVHHSPRTVGIWSLQA